MIQKNILYYHLIYYIAKNQKGGFDSYLTPREPNLLKKTSEVYES